MLNWDLSQTSAAFEPQDLWIKFSIRISYLFCSTRLGLDRLYNCLSGAELQLELFLHLRQQKRGHISPSCMFVSVCRPFIWLGHREQSKRPLVSVFSYLMSRLLCLQCLNGYHYGISKDIETITWAFVYGHKWK